MVKKVTLQNKLTLVKNSGNMTEGLLLLQGVVNLMCSRFLNKVFLLIFTFSLLTVASCGRETIEPLEWDILPPDYKTIDVRITDYCPSPGKDYIDFYASNLSARIENGELLTDFDRDGVVNILDNLTLLNLDPYRSDTNGDGYSDLLIYLSGIDHKNQSYLKRCETKHQDTDKDGLSDCEEDNFLHTHWQYFDTDHDGVPDQLEVRNKMNPRDPNDAFQDLDADLISNLDEVKLNTPIDVTNTKIISSLAYQYDVMSEQTEEGVCYELFIGNIPLVDVSNGNLIRFFIIEKLSEVEREMRTFRVIAEYDDLTDGEELTFELSSLVEGVGK